MSQPRNSDGIIFYQECKDIKGHKVIVNVVREKLADFVPQFKLRKSKNKIGGDTGAEE